MKAEKVRHLDEKQDFIQKYNRNTSRKVKKLESISKLKKKKIPEKEVKQLQGKVWRFTYGILSHCGKRVKTFDKYSEVNLNFVYQRTQIENLIFGKQLLMNDEKNDAIFVIRFSVHS